MLHPCPVHKWQKVGISINFSILARLSADPLASSPWGELQTPPYYIKCFSTVCEQGLSAYWVAFGLHDKYLDCVWASIECILSGIWSAWQVHLYVRTVQKTHTHTHVLERRCTQITWLRNSWGLPRIAVHVRSRSSTKIRTSNIIRKATAYIRRHWSLAVRLTASWAKLAVSKVIYIFFSTQSKSSISSSVEHTAEVLNQWLKQLGTPAIGGA